MYMLENVRMEHFSALFFKFICAKTQTYFRKYVLVFRETCTRFSANKFDAGLKRRFLSPTGTILHFVPDKDISAFRPRQGQFYI